MTRWIIVAFIGTICCTSRGFAQMPPAPILSIHELEAMKQDVKAVKTDGSNFEKRADFAKAWISALAGRGKLNEVQKVAPLGTIPRIKQSAAANAGNAYQELDRLFQELFRIEQSGPASPHPEASLPAQGGIAVTSKDLTVTNSASRARLWARIYYPASATPSSRYPAVIYIPGALGYGSDPLTGRAAEIIAAGGYVVGVFDPDGRGKSEGAENWNGLIQQEGLMSFAAAIKAQTSVDGRNVGLVSNSFGIALAAGALGHHPDDASFKYLIDVEGPSDRLSITLNDSPLTLSMFNNHRSADTEWWSEREPVAWISKIKIPYLRIQNEMDHVQPENRHAIQLINAATSAQYGGSGRSRWTRVNGPRNAPNTIYSAEHPPQWLSGKGSVTPTVLIDYIKEMAEMKLP